MHPQFQSRRTAIANEVLTPPFPEDVQHFDDGSWDCSKESFDLMSRSFSRFGFELEYSWSFETLFQRFNFVLGAASLMPAVEYGAFDERYSGTMIEYLQAVHSHDTAKAKSLLPHLVPTDDPISRSYLPAGVSAPKLRLVRK